MILIFNFLLLPPLSNTYCLIINMSFSTVLTFPIITFVLNCKKTTNITFRSNKNRAFLKPIIVNKLILCNAH